MIGKFLQLALPLKKHTNLQLKKSIKLQNMCSRINSNYRCELERPTFIGENPTGCFDTLVLRGSYTHFHRTPAWPINAEACPNNVDLSSVPFATFQPRKTGTPWSHFYNQFHNSTAQMGNLISDPSCPQDGNA